MPADLNMSPLILGLYAIWVRVEFFTLWHTRLKKTTVIQVQYWICFLFPDKFMKLYIWLIFVFNNISMQVRVGSNLPLVENWTCSSKSRTRSQNLSFSNLSPKWSSLLQERVGISDQTFCLLLAHYPAPLLVLFRYLAYDDILCKIFHIENVTFDTKYLMHDILYMIFDAQYLIMICKMRHLSIEYLMFDIWYAI